VLVVDVQLVSIMRSRRGDQYGDRERGQRERIRMRST